MYIHTTTSNLHTSFPSPRSQPSLLNQHLNPQETKSLPFHPRPPPETLSSADDNISPVISEDLAANRTTLATTADQSGGAVSQFTIGDAFGEGVLRGTLVSLSASIRRHCTLGVRMNTEEGREGGGAGGGDERAYIVTET